MLIISLGCIGINEDTIKQIVEKYLEQLHSYVLVEKAVLKHNTWIVTVSTGMPPLVRQLRIDAITGRILGAE